MTPKEKYDLDKLGPIQRGQKLEDYIQKQKEKLQTLDPGSMKYLTELRTLQFTLEVAYSED